MTEIKVLDKSVFNRIAAGEVVERPASVVKELVENSIDAGADNITITIKGGGIDYICVADNGKGIPANQIKTAFLPHATSKISSVEDLDGISTLGFRGEALPSIASVAKVTMLSRPHDCEMGCVYVIDNGAELDYGDMGAAPGTSVTVEGLFERIPARKKFLSRESVEENAITGLIARYILANSNISFKYVVNGKTVYISSGDGVENAILAVYGHEYLSNMVKVHSNMSDIVLYGYVNKPAFTKHSKAFQTLIVNGRYVISDEVSYTVFGCYQKYLMKRQYPTYVLYLNIPYDLVDVNVHPNKMVVKFALPGLIKKIVADTIKEQVLAAVSVPKDIDNAFDATMATKTDSFSPFVFSLKSDSERGSVTPAHSDNSRDSAPRSNKQTDDAPETYVASTRSDRVDAPSSNPSDDFSENTPTDSKLTSKITAVTSDILDNLQPSFATVNAKRREELKDRNRFDDIFSPIQTTPQKEQDKAQDRETISASNEACDDLRKPVVEQCEFSVADLDNYKVDGKLFNTYIVIEKSDSIYLIDQHAAHEKLLYDRYVAEYERGKVATQSMLVPYKFTVTPEESELLNENLNTLAATGFNIIADRKPNSYIVKAVPLCCVGLNVQSFVSDFLHELPDGSEKLLPTAFKEALMQSACKAATKGEDDLSSDEIEKLLSQIAKETTELFCPHGRPIAIRLTRREIEKWFKRIV